MRGILLGVGLYGMSLSLVSGTGWRLLFCLSATAAIFAIFPDPDETGRKSC